MLILERSAQAAATSQQRPGLGIQISQLVVKTKITAIGDVQMEQGGIVHGDKVAGDKVMGDKNVARDVSGNVGSHGNFSATTSSGATAVDVRTWPVAVEDLRRLVATLPVADANIVEAELVELEAAPEPDRPGRLARIADVAKQLGDTARPVLEFVNNIMGMSG